MSNTIFRSNNVHDVMQAAEKKYWDHTKAARQTELGDTIVILGSQSACGKIEMPYFNQPILIAEAASIATPVTHEDWASNEVGDSNKEYTARTQLTNVRWTTFGQLPKGAQDRIMRTNKGDKGRIGQGGIAYF